MRTIQFKLTPDESALVDEIGTLADYADLTPKQLFMRFIRVKLEEVSKEVIAPQPRPKGRPPVICDGLERKEWIEARIKAYKFAEEIAKFEDPETVCLDDGIVRDISEACWDSAVRGELVPSHLTTDTGRKYPIEFPPFDED